MAKKTDKLDLYKQHKGQYVAARRPVLIMVPSIPYLAIDGRGKPGDEDFEAKVGALYATAFTIKMTRKFAGKGDYKVCHLEGLYWTGRGIDWDVPPERLNWTLMIRVPDFIRAADLKAAVKALDAKGKAPAAKHVRLEKVREGRCVQMLHVGPYSDEKRTVAAMQQFAAEKGLTFHGRHHEIYISDPRRVPPERLRTILRVPVGKA